MTSGFLDRSLYDPRLDRCPLCGGGDIAGLHTISRYDPPFKVDRCSLCGFIFMNPRFTLRVIENLYTEGYFRGNAAYSYYDEREAGKYARHVWNARLNKIRRFVSSGRLLDVGCSFGGFLEAASMFFDPYGIEPSSYAAEHARRKLGDHVHAGTLEDHPFPDGFFSVITMIEVLEHIADPKRAVQACHSLLAPGGLLLVQTADMDGLQARLLKDRYAYFMPGHLSYFTKQNLTGLLSGAGFSRVLTFRPAEFGLLPKLMKSRSAFSSPLHYLRWIRISLYHLAGKMSVGSFSPTSALVLYALK